MIESKYYYKFEAEKNGQPGFKSFDGLTEALYYIDGDGVLRATCHPTVRDRVRTRTIYMLGEKTVGLSEQEIFSKLDEEVEKSLTEPIDYADLKDLSLADLIALEGWLERRKDYWSNRSGQAAENPAAAQRSVRQHEISSGMREGISLEISNRVTKIFPGFEYELDEK